ncbi:MAG: 4'-phosphopantetheinyl transferase superfamily protein [Chitinophagaceae bacterium]
MPLFYQHTINDGAKIGVWHIAEVENFYLQKVPLGRDITHWHKRLQHLAGRYLLQHLYPDFPYHLIEIADTRKPFLPNEEYHFSISHCGDYAAVIISKDHQVGIDIELLTERVERIKHKFLSIEEIANIQHSTFNTQHLTLLWCCKEAVFKWYGSAGVDFREDIHLKPFEINAEGIINCEFVKDETVPLSIQYKFFDGLCLAWVAT